MTEPQRIELPHGLVALVYLRRPPTPAVPSQLAPWEDDDPPWTEPPLPTGDGAAW